MMAEGGMDLYRHFGACDNCEKEKPTKYCNNCFNKLCETKTCIRRCIKNGHDIVDYFGSKKRKLQQNIKSFETQFDPPADLSLEMILPPTSIKPEHNFSFYGTGFEERLQDNSIQPFVGSSATGNVSPLPEIQSFLPNPMPVPGVPCRLNTQEFESNYDFTTTATFYAPVSLSTTPHQPFLTSSPSCTSSASLSPAVAGCLPFSVALPTAHNNFSYCNRKPSRKPMPKSETVLTCQGAVVAPFTTPLLYPSSIPFVKRKLVNIKAKPPPSVLSQPVCRETNQPSTVWEREKCTVNSSGSVQRLSSFMRQLRSLSFPGTSSITQPEVNYSADLRVDTKYESCLNTRSTFTTPKTGPDVITPADAIATNSGANVSPGQGCLRKMAGQEDGDDGGIDTGLRMV
jgi:hypothetical protein